MARLLPPESASLEEVSEVGVGADTLSRWRDDALGFAGSPVDRTGTAGGGYQYGGLNEAGQERLVPRARRLSGASWTMAGAGQYVVG